mmetsp:Transcript_150815/g.281374  ORF Transcript_150815/g.281374 Transcript_150815/m.281374 type:complete len:359 (-) Transcript_150815:96-1172(-)
MMSDDDSDVDDIGTVGLLTRNAGVRRSHSQADAAPAYPRRGVSEADSDTEDRSHPTNGESHEPTIRTMEEMCDSAEKEKLRGNKIFQQGNHLGAYSAYQSGIDVFSGIEPHNLSARARKVVVALYCNAAQAMLKRPHTPGATTLWACLMADKALELDPENVKALFRRGCAHGNAEEWSLARDDFEHVLLLDPNNEAARTELQRAEEALAAADLPFERAEQEKIQGNQLFQAGEYEESYKAFSRGIEVLERLKADSMTSEERMLLVTLCSNAAQVMLKCDGHEKALDLAEKALALDPADIKALYRRGHAYSKSQKWALARRDFQCVLQLDPKHEAAFQALQKIQSKAAKGGDGVSGSGA